MRYQLYITDDGDRYVLPFDEVERIVSLEESLAGIECEDTRDELEYALESILNQYTCVEGGDLTFSEPMYDGEAI